MPKVKKEICTLIQHLLLLSVISSTAYSVLSLLNKLTSLCSSLLAAQSLSYAGDESENFLQSLHSNHLDNYVDN